MAAAGWIEGWKGIVPIVGRCERTCRRWAQKERDPLPVYHYLGTVIMNRNEFAAWKRRQARSFTLMPL